MYAIILFKHYQEIYVLLILPIASRVFIVSSCNLNKLISLNKWLVHIEEKEEKHNLIELTNVALSFHKFGRAQ